MDQPQLFDTTGYTEQRPATHSEPLKSPSPAHEKLLRNRQRIEGTPGTVARAEDRHTAQMTDYGIPVRGAAPSLTSLSPFDTGTWRKFGQYAEMPLHGNDALPSFGTGQRQVSPQRIAEIERDPSLASDPRFPGRERPLVADVGFRRNGRVEYAPVLHNGNHRVAAETSRQLFIDVSYIPKGRLGDASAHAREQRAKYKDARWEKDDLAWNRLERKDATYKPQ